MVFRKNALWAGTIPHRYFQGFGQNFTGLVLPKAGRSSISPIFNIFIRSGDIRRQTLKSTEIGLNFACLWPLNFFGEGPRNFEFLFFNRIHSSSSCKISRRSVDGAR